MQWNNMHPLQRMRQLYRYDTDLQDAPLMGGGVNKQDNMYNVLQFIFFQHSVFTF